MKCCTGAFLPARGLRAGQPAGALRGAAGPGWYFYNTVDSDYGGRFCGDIALGAGSRGLPAENLLPRSVRRLSWEPPGPPDPGPMTSRWPATAPGPGRPSSPRNP